MYIVHTNLANLKASHLGLDHMQLTYRPKVFWNYTLKTENSNSNSLSVFSYLVPKHFRTESQLHMI